VQGEGSDPYLQRLNRTLNEEMLQAIIAAARQWYLPVRLAHQDDK